MATFRAVLSDSRGIPSGIWETNTKRKNVTESKAWSNMLKTLSLLSLRVNETIIITKKEE